MSGQCFHPPGRHLAGGNTQIIAAPPSKRNIHQITSAEPRPVQHLEGGLTCYETGHFSGIGVFGDHSSGGAHVDLERVERQQLTAVVVELGVDEQQATVVAEVAEAERQLLVRAVHLAEVQESRQGVDLLPPIGFSAKVVGGVSGSADRGGSEGREAVHCAVVEARVARRNLSGSRTRRSHTDSFYGYDASQVGFGTLGLTGMGMQGSVWLQLSSQFIPLLKERMLGENGVKVRSWSFHWPNKVTRWENSLSLTTPLSVVLRMLLDTCRT